MNYYKTLPTEAELVKVGSRLRCAWRAALTRPWAQLAAAQLVNGTSEDAKEGALLGLLELAGPVDVANDLHTLGALVPVLEQLRGGSGRLRALAAHVVGTAAANNPTVQAQVVALGGVELLLGAPALLQRRVRVPRRSGGVTYAAPPVAAARAAHDEPEARAKALYALSALARGPGLGRDAFMRASGCSVLRGILLAEAEPPRLRKKALLLVTDLAAQRDAPGGDGELREPALLGAVLSLLTPPEGGTPDDDLAEKVLRAMQVYLTADAPAAAAAAEVFLRGGADSALQALRLRLASAAAAAAAEGDDGGYYAELSELRDEVAAALRAAAKQPATFGGHDEL